MNMDAAFAAAARPERRKIMGLLMLPYSIGHEIVLLSEGSLLLTLTPDEFQKADLQKRITSIIRAVLVCSRDYRQIPHKWLKLWAWTNRKSDVEKCIADFREYRDEGSSFPRLATPAEESRSYGSPHLTRVLNFGLSKFGDRVYDMPLGLVHFLFFSEVEADGGCLVENADEREIRLIKEKHRADYAREQKEKELQCQP